MDQREGNERHPFKEALEFPGGPVVRTLKSHCRGMHSTPFWGTKLLQGLWNGPKKKEKKKIKHSLRNYL